jgi:hypothetical protein
MIHRMHLLPSGLRLDVSSQLTNALAEGEPFAFAETPAGGLAIALCDASVNWEDDAFEKSRRAAGLLAKIAATSTGTMPERLLAAMEDAGVALPLTCVALLLLVESAAQVAWCGDGAVFLLRDGAAKPVVRPHLLVEKLVADGRMSREEARTSPVRHVILKSLGDGQEADVSAAWEPLRGDRIVLCQRRLIEPFDQCGPSLMIDGTPDKMLSEIFKHLERPGEAAGIAIAIS